MFLTTGQRLILADGTRIENGEAGYADGFLWCYLPGMSMAQAGTLFFDPAKTSRIIFEYGEMSETYNGMTDCRNIRIDADGQIAVCMVKGDDTDV
jgi:hypothetical protein